LTDEALLFKSATNERGGDTWPAFDIALEQAHHLFLSMNDAGSMAALPLNRQLVAIFEVARKRSSW
jgi:hypothetical protein